MAVALPVDHICFIIVYPNPWVVLEVKETCRQAAETEVMHIYSRVSLNDGDTFGEMRH